MHFEHVQQKYTVLPTISSAESIFEITSGNYFWGYRDGSMIKRACCSFRRLWFQRTCKLSHNCL